MTVCSSFSPTLLWILSPFVLGPLDLLHSENSLISFNLSNQSHHFHFSRLPLKEFTSSDSSSVSSNFLIIKNTFADKFMHVHLKFDPSQLCISVAKVSVTRPHTRSKSSSPACWPVACTHSWSWHTCCSVSDCLVPRHTFSCACVVHVL